MDLVTGRKISSLKLLNKSRIILSKNSSKMSVNETAIFVEQNFCKKNDIVLKRQRCMSAKL
jgi:hypothetical protein